ncbi:ABC transporter ATP-binding protein [Nonomuraea rhodomycinica]|uniref:ABC transporter ATP-binding protein n=1 Tax=Nonomuraea rhodomycinica TaxID=1712872 RepID=A0A7Y6MEV2_9ACTN|nr:ABC transporter ATP-binding protein [Nonomuraea rhodomycinica]NUW44345.1 ABC transporter ATP-binding protein [Nonomuraea rhodomycinica]
MSTRISVRGSSSWLKGVLSATGLAWKAGPDSVTLLTLLTVMAAVLPVGMAWLTKMTIDSIVVGDDVIPLAVALAVAGLLYGLVPNANRFLRAELERATGVLAQGRLYTAVNALPGLARFEDPAFLDRLRLASQFGGRTPAQLLDGTLGLFGGVLTISGLLGSLFTLYPLLAGVALTGTVPMLIAEIALARRRAALMWGLEPAQRREFFYGQLLSDAEAAKEVRLFGLGAFLRDRMLSERRQADVQRRRLDRRELLVQSVLAALAAAISGAGVVFVVAATTAGGLGVGDVSMFLLAMTGVQSGVAGLVAQAAGAHQQLLLFRHFQDVETVEPDLAAPERLTVTLPLQTAIELRDVWFRYSPEHPWILRGVNLVIPRGKAVALIGRNGSGKSTIVKLLCRFYDPERGSVFWDGTDIRMLDPAELRKRIGAVFQDFMAYHLSAAENIGLGDLSLMADQERIEEAARRAGVHDELSALPRGYDTLLTRIFADNADKDDPTTGVFLSGGQWQRVALARAMLGEDHDLLILDEPSSGLDAEAEHEIHVMLKEHRRGRTSLLISHRLGAVRDADSLVVLDGGQVVEQGTHDELMRKGGVYTRLFTLQASRYQGEQMEVG